MATGFEPVSIAMAAVLTFVQALLVNDMVNSNKVLPKKNYLAGAVFIIFSSFFKENLLLSPALISLTFIILATSKIFSLIKKEKSYADVFDVGFLIAIAALFYFPCVLLLVFAYIGLATVRSFNYREWTIVLLGFLSPFIIAFTFYYWNNQGDLFFTHVANIQPTGWLLRTPLELVDKIMIGALVLCTGACLVFLPASLYSSLIQVRKFANILVVLMLFVLAALLLQQTMRLNHLVLLALPLGVIAAIVFAQIKNKVVAEVIHLILILLVLAGQFLPMLNII